MKTLILLLFLSTIASNSRTRLLMGGYTEVALDKSDKLLSEVLYVGRNHVLKELIDASVSEFTIKNNSRNQNII
jgi:hypothetical protein